MNPLISVVIPIYRAEEYIKDCLISILNQQVQSWECLLIEDGSPDHSGVICDEFALRDNRFKVIHKQNEGVSVARNMGTEMARGEWITYIDSDDIITDDFFSTFFKRLTTEQFDLFMGDVEQERLDGVLFVEYNLPTTVSTLKESIQKHRILRSGDLHGKFFKNEIIKNLGLRFERNVKYSEDGLFFDIYLCHCQYIALDKTICYRYRRNETGLSFKINSFNSEYYCMKELIKALSCISNSTQIPLRNLLHDSPAKRTLMSALSDLSIKEFATVFHNFTDVEAYFIERVLKNFSHIKIFVLLYNYKRYYLLYILLKVHENYHKLKKEFLFQ